MDKIAETILKFLRLDNIVHNLTGFVEDRIELMKVEIKEDVGKVIARGMVMIALFLMGFLFLISLVWDSLILSTGILKRPIQVTGS